MNFIQEVFTNITSNFNSTEIYPSLFLSMIIMVTILSAYEFFVYNYVLRRSLYNKALSICIALIPYFISTIILSMQSNLIITLGTIGALAIIRFRTAVKDPVDIIFILWAIHIGIMCGCRLYGVGIATAIIATVVLVILNHVNVGRKTHILIINLHKADDEEALNRILSENTKAYRVKSRNYNGNGINLVIELVSMEMATISNELSQMEPVEKFSLMEYETDDIL